MVGRPALARRECDRAVRLSFYDQAGHELSALEGQDVTATQFPLAASGGVFLSIVGVAIVLGALRFRSRNVLLAAGAVLATIVTALVAPGLTARAGVPTIAQSVWLAAAVAAEIVLLAVFIRRAAPHGERAVVLTILGIVAAHFLPMAPAFGPSMISAGPAVRGERPARRACYRLLIAFRLGSRRRTEGSDRSAADVSCRLSTALYSTC